MPVNRTSPPPAAPYQPTTPPAPYNPPAQPYQPTTQSYHPATPPYNPSVQPYNPAQAAMGQPAYEEEVSGLAAGVAARGRPVSQATMEMNAPALGTFTAQVSKYYTGQVVDPISGTHYDAASGRVVAGPNGAIPRKGEDIVLHWDDTPPLSRQLPRFLAAFGGILLVAALIAGWMPAAYVAPLSLAIFAGAMLMPVFKLVPWQDEDSSDAVWLAVLTLVFGPAIGLIIYGAICAMRQDFVPAVFGCMLIALVARLAILGGIQLLNPVAFHDMHLSFMQALGPPWMIAVQGENANETVYEWGLLFINWTPILAIVGWISANVFHKEDE